MKRIARILALLTAGLLSAALVTSCSNSPQTIVKTNQAELSAQLDRLDAIAAKAGQITKLESDQITLPPDAPQVNLSGVCFGFEPHPPYFQRNANLQVFSVAELQKSLDTEPAKVDMFGARELVWKQVKEMVKNGRFPKDNQDAITALNAFPLWQYVIVFTIRESQAPSVNPGYTGGTVTDKSSSLTGSFTGGHVKGDALLFDLRSGSFLGGFPVEAQNSANVESTTYGGDDASAAAQRRLDEDLIKQIRGAIGEGLRKRLPPGLQAYTVR